MKSVPKPYRSATFLGSDLKNIISYEKKPTELFWLKSAFPLHFIPLDPETRAQMKADPTKEMTFTTNFN